MRYIRTPLSTRSVISIEEARQHARLDPNDHSEDLGLQLMIEAVTAEFEAQCNLALIPATIVAITDDCPGCVVELPVGPIEPGTVVTVEAIADDGGTSTATGWTLQAGLHPCLHFVSTETAGRLRITYEAGFTVMPSDLVYAIADQAARLFDHRGGLTDRGAALSPHAARVLGRFKRVRA